MKMTVLNEVVVDENDPEGLLQGKSAKHITTQRC